MLYVSTFWVRLVVHCNVHVFFGSEAFEQHVLRILTVVLVQN